jgi:HTH-type transcriptional regulator/antitoxin HigA
MTTYEPDYAIAPAETIEELRLDRRYDEKYAQVVLQLTPEDYAALMKGDLWITPQLAQRLEMLFGLSAAFWSNLEANYRRNLADRAAT